MADRVLRLDVVAEKRVAAQDKSAAQRGRARRSAGVSEGGDVGDVTGGRAGQAGQAGNVELAALRRLDARADSGLAAEDGAGVRLRLRDGRSGGKGHGDGDGGDGGELHFWRRAATFRMLDCAN